MERLDYIKAELESINFLSQELSSKIKQVESWLVEYLQSGDTQNTQHCEHCGAQMDNE